jgi:hypothetical protein
MAHDLHPSFTALGPHNPYHFGTAAAGKHAPPGERFVLAFLPRDGFMDVKTRAQEF